MPFVTVFDVSQSGYHTWPFALPGLCLIVLAVGYVLSLRDPTLRWGPFRNPPPGPLGPDAGKRAPERVGVRAHLALAFGVLWTVVAFVGTLQEYLSLRGALESRVVEVTSGLVDHYQLLRNRETFAVCGVGFSYSDSDVSSAFNRTARRGGPIRAGLCVRVHHLRGKIAKLEIANECSKSAAKCPCSGTHPKNQGGP